MSAECGFPTSWYSVYQCRYTCRVAHQGNAIDSFQLGAVVPRTLADEATDRLRDAIRYGQLRPGTRLVERNLAAQLQMSRIPLREAIRRLVDEGLVTKIAHRGTFVYALAEDDIEEISSLRVVLERFVVERVVDRIQPEDVVGLKSIVNEMRTVATMHDFHRLYELDLRFHRTLWEIAAHPLLLETVSNLRSRISLFLYQAALAPETAFHPQKYIESHEGLLRAVTSGDVPCAQNEITRHILSSKDRILASSRTNTE
jgi:DNA-binding GntR family transcriptional regulator